MLKITFTSSISTSFEEAERKLHVKRECINDILEK
jgi:hypothetical protein